MYNRFFGKELIDEYLASRNPYAGCGMMVLDVDYFKNVNDTYGHMFGDEVLKRFAELFVALFDINDVIMRLGGDEFVILLKDISHAAIMKKAGKLIREVQKLKFPGTTYLATCSVGSAFFRKMFPDIHISSSLKMQTGHFTRQRKMEKTAMLSVII